MFPLLYEEMKDLVPEVYFGGDEVPPYYHLRVESPETTEELVSSIRLIGCGSNCSGFIDGEGIHFHLPMDETIWVDLSKEFVFVSQPTADHGSFPTAWQLFFFLQEPVRKALFVGEHSATLVEKTGQTLKLCRTLDQLWAQDYFGDIRFEMADSDDAREKGLARLMKLYEEEVLGSSSEMWEFWNPFAGYLMTHNLGLLVTTLLA
jgi:hypothetical protein